MSPITYFRMQQRASIAILFSLVYLCTLEYSIQEEDSDYQTLDEMLRDADIAANNKADYSSPSADGDDARTQSSTDSAQLTFTDDEEKFDYDPAAIDVVSHRLLAMLNKTKSRAEGLRNRLVSKREQINRKLSTEPSLTLSRLDAKLAEKIDELDRQIAAPSEESFSRNNLKFVDYCTCANTTAMENKHANATNATSQTSSSPSPRILIIK